MIRIRLWSDIRKIYDGNSQHILLPSTKGLLLIQENHGPLLCRLVKGTVVLSLNQEEKKYFFIAGGIFDFHSNQGSLFGSDIQEVSEHDLDHHKSQK